MADKLFAGGGPGGGLWNVALPIGLGVAAAAHPSLARGAQVISATMQNAQRNRRLQEAKEMQEKYFGMAQRREKRADEAAEYEKSQRPVKEARSRLVGTVGGAETGTEGLFFDQSGQIVKRPLTEPFALTPQGQAVQGVKHGEWQSRQDYSHQQALERMQKQHELSGKTAISPNTAMSQRTILLGKMLTEKRWLMDNSELTEEQADRIVNERYKGELEYLNRFLPGGGLAIPESPPAGYRQEVINGVPVWTDGKNVWVPSKR